MKAQEALQITLREDKKMFNEEVKTILSSIYVRIENASKNGDYFCNYVFNINTDENVKMIVMDDLVNAGYTIKNVGDSDIRISWYMVNRIMDNGIYTKVMH